MTEETAPAIEPAAAPVAAPQGRKICILGTTPSRGLAPFSDDSWEFWTIGPGGKDANRWDMLFEVHGPSTWPEGFKEYITQLSQVQPEKRICNGREITKTVITMEPMAGWASNAGMPRKQIEDKYGWMWLSSSISWCIALAIEMGATEIGLYGIDLESGEEYEAQFEGARFFMDHARLTGIKLHLPPGCGLLRDPKPYPDRWESVESLYVQKKLEYLRPILTQKHNQLAQTQSEVYQLQGEMGFGEHWLKMFTHKGIASRPKDFSSPWS